MRHTQPQASFDVLSALCQVSHHPSLETDETVKQWDAHLLTKQHRQSVAREKEIAAKLEKERAKKRAMEEASAPSAKRARVEEDNDDDDGPKLPPGFFSDGKGPAVEDDEEESPRPVAEPAPPATGDAELDSFLASLDDDEPAPAPTAAKKKAGYKLSAEEGVASYAAAPIMLNDAKKEQEAEPEVRETEAEKRARLAREEKEEVMARLEEEERAQ